MLYYKKWWDAMNKWYAMNVIFPGKTAVDYHYKSLCCVADNVGVKIYTLMGTMEGNHTIQEWWVDEVSVHCSLPHINEHWPSKMSLKICFVEMNIGKWTSKCITFNF